MRMRYRKLLRTYKLTDEQVIKLQQDLGQTKEAGSLLSELLEKYIAKIIRSEKLAWQMLDELTGIDKEKEELLLDWLTGTVKVYEREIEITDNT